MTQGNSTTVYIDLIDIPTELTIYRDRLSGKGFIGFDEIEIVHTPTRLLEAPLGGRYGTGAHNGRIDTRGRVRHNVGHRFKAEGFCLACGGHDNSGCPIVDPRGIPRRDRARLVKSRAELAP